MRSTCCWPSSSLILLHIHGQSSPQIDLRDISTPLILFEENQNLNFYKAY